MNAPIEETIVLPTTSRRQSGTDFGKFMVELAGFLTVEIVFNLATYFEFTNAQKDRLRNEEYPGQLMVEWFRERGIITQTDISPLINALVFHKLDGVKEGVLSSFQSYLPGRHGNDGIQGKHSMLVNALKTVYRKRYSGVNPIPFLHDTCHCVNDIFVESRIEVLDRSKSKEDPSRWSSIKSRHEIFTKPTFERHITIEGEPGFGKSTLLLQYAYDWCTSSEASLLRNSYIFILLRLKEVKDVPSIYDAIKMLLPEDLPLTSQDIKNIFTSLHWKVVLALDGYDEYSGMYNKTSDINKIIHGHMLIECIIIITTRPSCQPKVQSPTVKHCKLTGFDQDMQEEYIDKVVTSHTGSGMKELIMKTLGENVVLADICQVPMFFAIFAHMKSTGAKFQNLNSLTSYFTFMLACFFNHQANKAIEVGCQSEIKQTTENPGQRLQIAKVAFDGLIGKAQTLLWSQHELSKVLEPSCCNQYINAGILLEEEHGVYNVIPGSHADDQIEVTTYVRFFHKTFQEFYAAHYIVHLSETGSVNTVAETLTALDLCNFQYVMRFACGLKHTAARVVQDYLNKIGEDGRILSFLCFMEQEAEANESTVAHLCSEQVTINLQDSKFLQRSKIQLLQTASQQNVPISSMLLRNCFQSVDLNEESICLSSGLQLPRLDSLQEFEISFRFGYDLRDKVRDILVFSASCVALKSLKFCRWTLLPRSFHGRVVLTNLYRKRCKVKWLPYHLNWVHLNMQTGKWEDEDGREMTDDQYHKESSSFDSTKRMSEPRLTIRNVATHHILYVGSSWNATTSSEDKKEEQAALFKVQCCEKINGIAKTVLIRTDRHPQSLLDVRNLCYQGRAWNPNKCSEQNRWWNLTWLKVAEGGMPTVLFQSYTKKTYLAEKKGGTGVEVIQLSEHIDVKDVPDRAKWELTIGGKAMSPGQAAFVYFSLPIHALTGTSDIDEVLGPMTPTFTASGTTNDFAAGAAIGDISAFTTTASQGILKDVSKVLFLDAKLIN